MTRPGAAFTTFFNGVGTKCADEPVQLFKVPWVSIKGVVNLMCQTFDAVRIARTFWRPSNNYVPQSKRNV
jgi:hypothetical protein